MTEVTPPRQHEKYNRLIAAAKNVPPLTTAVAHPCDETSLRGALEAAEAGLIIPILVGPKGLAEGKLELKRRSDDMRESLSPADVLARLA